MLDERTWTICTDFHGHDCPGIALGFKVVEGAADLLGIEGTLPQTVPGLSCVSTTLKCPVDAVRCLLGCTEESGTLLFPPSSPTDMDFTFALEPDGKKVRLSAKPHTFGGRRGREAIEYVLSVPYTELLDVEVLDR